MGDTCLVGASNADRVRTIRLEIFGSRDDADAPPASTAVVADEPESAEDLAQLRQLVDEMALEIEQLRRELERRSEIIASLRSSTDG